MEVERKAKNRVNLKEESEELTDEEESEELHKHLLKRMCLKREMELKSRAPAFSVERVSHVKEA